MTGQPARRRFGVRLYPAPTDPVAEVSFPDGYTGEWRPLWMIRLRSSVRMLDPQFRRRLFRMMRDAHKAGIALGIGGAGRSSDTQLAGFLDRHVPVGAGGCCEWNGQRYQLRPGVAHMAPPNLSYHEPTTPKGKALAADMVGDLVWMGRVCAFYDLVVFTLVNREPWHTQPRTIPTSRRYYQPTVHHPLPRWIRPRKERRRR